ncbi:MAG: Rrf2 family transcriptional regulator [Bacillota bacterium]|nr:Rrf2 family transcriptional regulator [Bacillota bacterium]
MNSDFVIASHSLVLLANLPGHMANSEMIAENVCTNPARVRKIMSTLRKNGLVKTKEGIGGGYILNCDPEKTTLSQIYKASSYGSLKPHWCTGDPEKSCVISSNTQVIMDQIFNESELHLQSFFNQITISNVLERIKNLE